MILFLILSLLVGCSIVGCLKPEEPKYIAVSKDVKLDVDVRFYEVKDGFLISYKSDWLDGPEILSKILNKFKISVLDVIDFSLQTKYSYDCVILVKKTTELENKISEYLKESENK